MPHRGAFPSRPSRASRPTRRRTRRVERLLLAAALGEATIQVPVGQVAGEGRRGPDGDAHADGLERRRGLGRQQQPQHRAAPEPPRRQHRPARSPPRPLRSARARAAERQVGLPVRFTSAPRTRPASRSASGRGGRGPAPGASLFRFGFLPSFSESPGFALSSRPSPGLIMGVSQVDAPACLPETAAERSGRRAGAEGGERRRRGAVEQRRLVSKLRIRVSQAKSEE